MTQLSFIIKRRKNRFSNENRLLFQVVEQSSDIKSSAESNDKVFSPHPGKIVSCDEVAYNGPSNTLYLMGRENWFDEEDDCYRGTTTDSIQTNDVLQYVRYSLDILTRLLNISKNGFKYKETAPYEH